MTEKRIRELQDKSVEIMQSKEQKKRVKKLNKALEKCETPLRTNICIMEAPEGEKEKIVKEIMAEYVSNLMRNTNLHLQEAQ